MENYQVIENSQSEVLVLKTTDLIDSGPDLLACEKVDDVVRLGVWRKVPENGSVEVVPEEATWVSMVILFPSASIPLVEVYLHPAD